MINEKKADGSKNYDRINYMVDVILIGLRDNGDAKISAITSKLRNDNKIVQKGVTQLLLTQYLVTLYEGIPAGGKGRKPVMVKATQKGLDRINRLQELPQVKRSKLWSMA